MSGKLDKSLDEILVNRRQGARRRSRRSATSKATTATVPVGGVKKSTKAAKVAGKVVPNGHPVSHESKIMVSGLPSDVNEANIKYASRVSGISERISRPATNESFYIAMKYAPVSRVFGVWEHRPQMMKSAVIQPVETSERLASSYHGHI
ncbi:hypothetical protein ATERTT37_004623 [Aspergillus terreus]